MATFILCIMLAGADEQPQRIDWSLYENSPATLEYIRDVRLNRVARRSWRMQNGGIGLRNRVGIRPIISVLPEGTYMGGMVTVSGDRRYVRINMMPYFSSIGRVYTFSFQH